jgi:hypothetical protein
MKKRILFTILLLVGALSLFSVPLDLHLAIVSLEEAQEPFFVDNYIVFSYPKSNSVRLAAIAFKHENFTTLHRFQINPSGVFIFYFDRPEDLNEIEYRIILDGLWTNDPNQVFQRTDSRGSKISVLPLPLQRSKPIISPLIDGQKVTFLYQGRQNQTISVAGSFNNFDPFIYPLKEIEPGTYQASYFIRSGKHEYIFIIDGRRMLDPLNPSSIQDMEGNQFSVLQL